MKRKIVLLAAVFLLLAGMGSATEQVFYHLNETSGTTVVDFSGQNNDGIRNGATQGVDGAPNTDTNNLAYDFEADNSESINTTATISGTQNITYASWVRPETVDTNNRHVFGQIPDDSGSSQCCNMLRDNGDGNLRFIAVDTTGTSVDVTTSASHLNAGQWVHLVATYDGNGNVSIYTNGSLAEDFSVSDIGEISSFGERQFIGANNNDGTIQEFWDGRIDEPRMFFDGVTATEANNLFTCNRIGSCEDPPTFNTNATEPPVIDFGDTVNLTANVTDPDGNLDTVWAQVEENGTVIVSNETLTDNDGDDVFNLTDAFTVDETDVWYNTTFYANDTDGELSVARNNQFISDDPPTITFNSPANTTFFDYDTTLNATIEDDLSTNVTAWLFINGGNVSQVENRTVPYFLVNTTRLDLGQHNFTVIAQDEANQNNTASRFFTIDDYKIFPANGVNQTTETVNETYNVTVHLGDMINRVDTNLIWRDTVNGFDTTTSSQEQNVTLETFYESELVDNNNTQIGWNFNFTFNRTELDGSFNTSITDNTTNTTQFVFHGFTLNTSQVDPSSYLEDQEYNFEMNFSAISFKPSFTATNTYHRTDETVDATDSNNTGWIFFNASQNVGNVSTGSNQSFNTSGTLNISFQDRFRTIEAGNSTLFVNKIRITDCSPGSASQTVALNFTTHDENDRDNMISSDLDIALEVWDVGNPGFKNSYNFSSTGQTFHEFCIFPADEDYIVDTTRKLIQYEADDFSQRSYFLINETVSNTTTTIPLYLLNSSLATEVEYSITDDNNDPASQIIVKIERYFAGVDQHILVSMIRTGSEGTSRTFLEKNEIYYQHKFFENKELVDEAEDQLIPLDDSFEFQIGEDAPPSYYEFKAAIGFSCTTANVYVNCSYTSTTEQLDTITLRVQRDEAIGFTTVCTSTGTTSTGELVCSGLNATNSTYRYSLKADMNDGQVISLFSDWLTEVSNVFGDMGLFVAFGLFITMGLAGIFLPEAVIMFGTLALVVSFATNLIALPPSAIISIVLVSGILLWRMV